MANPSILVDHHPTQRKKPGFNHGKCKPLYDRIIVKESLHIQRLLPWSHASFVVMGQTDREHRKTSASTRNWRDDFLFILLGVFPVLLWPVDIQRGLSMNTLYRMIARLNTARLRNTQKTFGGDPSPSFFNGFS